MSQFLGKTISIVSNSNVRYVGVLHEINTNESTLSLKGARSFGAEGGGHEPYLAESVFDCIVFKSSDVKNLSLLDSVPSEHISNFSFATQVCFDSIDIHNPLSKALMMKYFRMLNSFSEALSMQIFSVAFLLIYIALTLFIVIVFF